MIGLIKKDLMMAKKQMLIVTVLMVFYCVVLGNGKSADYQLGMFSGYLVAFMSILPITMLAYDEKNKWGKYASALPVSRNQQVLSKYIIMIVLVLLAIIIFTVLTIITGGNIGDISEQMSITFASSIIVSSITLTLAYKFGTSKARYIFFGLIFVIMIIMSKTLIGNTDIDMTKEFVQPHGFAIMCVVFGSLVYISCCCLSMYLYSKKDL